MKYFQLTLLTYLQILLAKGTKDGWEFPSLRNLQVRQHTMRMAIHKAKNVLLTHSELELVSN